MAPTIRIDEEVMTELKERAKTMDMVFGTPNAVLRRLLGISEPVTKERDTLRLEEENEMVDGADFASFVSFCKTLEGETMPTVGGRTQFTLSSVREDNIDFYVPATGNVRGCTRNNLRRVFARYGARMSLRTTDYQDVTVNSSYILALIRRFLDDRGEAETPDD